MRKSLTRVEDEAIEHQEVLVDGFVTNALGQMRFAHTGRAKE